MDIKNIKRSVIIAAGIAIAAFMIFILVTALMFQKHDVAFTSPVIVRKNPTVTYADGETLYLANKSSSWKNIEIGDVLKEGGAVKTGTDGVLDIKFSDGTAMRITGNSFLSIDDVSLVKVSVGLKKGRLISKFTRMFSNQHFSVRTPSAVAGIRGTELVFNVSGNTSEIVGMSGITEVYNPAFPEKRVLLGFQTKTVLSADTPPVDPVPLSQEEVSAYRKMLDSIHYNEVIVIGAPIQFKPDTAEITESSRKDLEKLAKKIRWHRYKIEIEGHTADVGDSVSQYSLSLERAKRIRDFLVSLKVSKKRLSVRGYGGSKPIASNASPEGRAKNRRVEFIIRK